MPQPRKYATEADRQAAYRRRCEDSRRRQIGAKGLPPLPVLPTVPGTVRWKAALEHARLLVASIGQEMENYYGDRSELWQDSDKGEEFTARLEAIQELHEQIEEIADQW